MMSKKFEETLELKTLKVFDSILITVQENVMEREREFNCLGEAKTSHCVYIIFSFLKHGEKISANCHELNETL